MSNVLHAIVPYVWNGLWVFDDPERGLKHEALMAGADTVLEAATAHIPDRKQGVVCLFSDGPFPGFVVMLVWRRPAKIKGNQGFGDTYWCEQLQLEAWLCPALLLYFPKPPKRLYVRFSAKPKTTNPTKQHEQSNLGTERRDLRNGRAGARDV